MRHPTELAAVVGAKYSLDSITSDKTVFVVVTDDGPDHRLTYTSVKLSYLALFIYLNIDMLMAAYPKMYSVDLCTFATIMNYILML